MILFDLDPMACAYLGVSGSCLSIGQILLIAFPALLLIIIGGGFWLIFKSWERFGGVRP